MHEFRLDGRLQTVEGGRRIVTRVAERRWGLRAMWAYHRFIDRVTGGRATTVRIATERRAVTARVATADEAAALSPRLDRVYPTYESSRRNTTRTIPIVILEPAS